MVRAFAIACVLSCLGSTGWAQVQPAPGTAAAPAAAPAKPATKKPAPKAKISAKPAAPADSGPCQIGVISAIGDQFTVQSIGLTVFGNEQMEAPIDAWGLDDLVVARVRAAAPGTAIRKIAYARGAFEPYYHPEAKLFRNGRQDLTAVVRQIAGNANCERYIVAAKITAVLESTNQELTGIGVYKSWASPSKRGVVVANFNLTVFDGRTFEIHRAPLPNFGAMVASAFVRSDDALRILNDLEFPTSAEQAANNAMLRDSARNLITARLDKVLPAYLKGE